MKVSKKLDYGLKVMVELGLRYREGPIFLKKIAEEKRLPFKYLTQIIIDLKAAGLVYAYRGAHGGYILAKPPSQISLKDIVEALEGKLSLISCMENPSDCRIGAFCGNQKIWKKLQDNINDFLTSLCLEDLLKEDEQMRKVLMYNI